MQDVGFCNGTWSNSGFPSPSPQSSPFFLNGWERNRVCALEIPLPEVAMITGTTFQMSGLSFKKKKDFIFF